MTRRTVLAAAVSLVAATVSVPATATPSATTTEIRLLSGDVVTLGGERGTRVRPATGREHVTFYIREDERGHTQVVPEDALVPLAQGRLDPALFDTRDLARHRDTLPLIVDFRGATPRSARVTRNLPVLGAAAVAADLSGAQWASVRDADHVWLDAPMRLAATTSTPHSGATTAQAGGTGEGATVAILDTGIDATHPDLADAIVGTKILSDSTTIDDRDGYGTHIASTIAGDSAKYPGVAPDAELLIGKVVGDDGWTYTSSVIAGMEWAAASGADVVNMSLESGRPGDGTDPVSLALNELTAKTGTLFVVAAGDTGIAEGISTPGAADAALTVGAVDNTGELAVFSARGPRRGDGAPKPDLTAPGVGIVAAKAANGTQGHPVEDGYVALTGTSMSTAYTSGAAAILAAQHPDWSPERLRAGLMGTARQHPGRTVFEQGAGQVDIAAATGARVVASAGSLDFGRIAWPHTDDEPVTKTVTYTNTGTTPVTLDLAVDLDRPEGAAMFAVTPSRLTVPAGGQATTTVTANTQVTAPDGVYTGAIVAGLLRTPFTVHREVATHTVTLTVIGTDGTPSDLFASRFTNVAPEPYYPRTYQATDPSGTVTLRLPAGEYFVDATALEPVGDRGDYRNVEFAEPAFTVTGDTTLVFDAREAKPVDLRGDRADARTTSGWVVFVRDTPAGRVAVQASGQHSAFENMTVRPSTTSSADFQFVTEANLARWNGTSFDNSPYFYHLRHTERGAVPTTLRWRQHDRDLAKVRTTHARTRPGTIGQRDYAMRFPLPHTMTEYFTPDKEWSFNHEYAELLADGSDRTVTSSRQIAPMFFAPGSTTTMRWGAGVFGPAVPTSTHQPGTGTAARWPDPFRGDQLYVAVPMRTDQDPGRVGYQLEGHTWLLRDGTVIAESDTGGGGQFTVGEERAEYTLRSTVTPADAGLSTQITAEWTFTSVHTTENVAIPLLALRFAPGLDNDNAAPAGKRFRIPFYVQRNGAETPGTVNPPTVETSYDDGKTWTRAQVNGHTATVNHPKYATFVSLRSTITDPDGNRQSQTIIRAYALR